MPRVSGPEQWHRKGVVWEPGQEGVLNSARNEVKSDRSRVVATGKHRTNSRSKLKGLSQDLRNIQCVGYRARVIITQVVSSRSTF